MEKRLFIMLTLLVIIGGIAGTFSPSIAQALTPPATTMQVNTPQRGQMSTATKSPQSPGKQPGGSQTSTPVPATSTPAVVLAQDTFQRANQSLWGQSSDGRQWQGDANTSSAFSIKASTGQISGSAGIVYAILGSAGGDINVRASGQVNQFGSDVNLGVCYVGPMIIIGTKL